MMEFEKYMVCQYCNLILDNPYESKCCGKLFCLKCTENIDTENCSKCYKIQEFRQNSFVKRLLNQMTLKCFFNCGQKLHSSNLRHHMIYCEEREYRCHFCDEDYYYGIGKSNKNANFLGKKKQFLLHLVENHGERIIDFHEKIPKDEKFRYFSNRPHHQEININQNKKEDIIDKINFNYENYENDEIKKEGETNSLIAIKEEEKEASFTEQKDLTKPLIPRSDHYYSFLDKMKLFDLPVERKTNIIINNNNNKNYNTTTSNNAKNNPERTNSNSDLITSTLDISKKESSSQYNNYFNHNYGKKLKYNGILDWNRNVFNSNNSVRYDYKTDLEFEHKVLKTSLDTELIEDKEPENKYMHSFSNKYLEMYKKESPEIYKTLNLKRNCDSKDEGDIDSNKKEKEEEHCSFSNLFIEDYVEDEDKKQKDHIQKFLDEMHKISFSKDTKIEKNSEKEKGNDAK